MTPDFPALLLACVADHRAGATAETYAAHAERRRDLAAAVYRRAEERGFPAVRFESGDGRHEVVPGAARWTDWLTRAPREWWAGVDPASYGDAMLALDGG